MQGFLSSKRFKLLLALLALLLGFMLQATRSGGVAPLASRLLSFLTTPAAAVSSSVSYSVGGMLDGVLGGKRIQAENDALRQELRQLREQLVELEQYKRENVQLKASLDIKEANPLFSFEPATVIGRDSADRFYSFTVNKGSQNGVAPRDQVISADGLVGVVDEVGPNYAQVITILDPLTEVGCQVASSGDTGVTSGTIAFARDGLLRLSYLPRSSALAVGDFVITSGVGGAFPSGIIVGQIEELFLESSGLSRYASVRPVANIPEIKDVLIIKQTPGGEQ